MDEFLKRIRILDIFCFMLSIFINFFLLKIFHSPIADFMHAYTEHNHAGFENVVYFFTYLCSVIGGLIGFGLLLKAFILFLASKIASRF